MTEYEYIGKSYEDSFQKYKVGRISEIQELISNLDDWLVYLPKYTREKTLKHKSNLSSREHWIRECNVAISVMYDDEKSAIDWLIYLEAHFSK